MAQQDQLQLLQEEYKNNLVGYQKDLAALEKKAAHIRNLCGVSPEQYRATKEWVNASFSYPPILAEKLAQLEKITIRWDVS